MDKRVRNILVLIGIVLVSLIIIQFVRPKPLNWSPSYMAQDKIPLGCYILYDQLSHVFPESTQELITQVPFEFLTQRDSTQTGTLIWINTRVGIDTNTYTELITFIEAGNTVFMSAHFFGGVLRDSLNIETRTSTQSIIPTVIPNFYDAENEIYRYENHVDQTYFSSFDTLKIQKIGFINEPEAVLVDSDDEIEEYVNYIQINIGRGKLLVHTLPEVFTNYHLLNTTTSYPERVLSYITNPGEVLYWNEYSKDGFRQVRTPMRYVLAQPALRWAYYTLLFGLIVFAVFRGKREQRIIPIVKPLQNESLSFAKAIAHLYFKNKDYGDLIRKRITYFLQNIRSQYYMNTTTLDHSFIEVLTAKSGRPANMVEELIQYIVKMQSQERHSEAQLVRLNRLIEKFTNQDKKIHVHGR